MFYLREHNIYDGLFFYFYKLKYFFILTCGSKYLTLTHCITKTNHVWKYFSIFFFFNLKETQTFKVY